jgi:hypothetical protein
MSHSADYTGRWKIIYNSFNQEHSFVIRFPQSVGLPTVTHADTLTNALSTLVDYLPRDFLVLAADFAVAGSDDFLPAVAPVTNTVQQQADGYDITVAGNLWEQAGEIKFHWKAAGPSMTNFSILGFHVDAFSAAVGVKHKVSAALNGATLGARNQLMNLPVCAANGIIATMRTYVTYQYNSYWESH